jgi:hypothetical protein
MLTPDKINNMPPERLKIVEARLRRMAARQDLYLTKSRVRDPRSPDYSTYRLCDNRGNLELHNGQGHGVDLDDVEKYLLEGDIKPVRRILEKAPGYYLLDETRDATLREDVLYAKTWTSPPPSGSGSRSGTRSWSRTRSNPSTTGSSPSIR